jgi:hypothetical protein
MKTEDLILAAAVAGAVFFLFRPAVAGALANSFKGIGLPGDFGSLWRGADGMSYSVAPDGSQYRVDRSGHMTVLTESGQWAELWDAE